MVLRRKTIFGAALRNTFARDPPEAKTVSVNRIGHELRTIEFIEHGVHVCAMKYTYISSKRSKVGL